MALTVVQDVTNLYKLYDYEEEHLNDKMPIDEQVIADEVKEKQDAI
jgi:hypothetical protein